jgi:four helix bundle protein
MLERQCVSSDNDLRQRTKAFSLSVIALRQSQPSSEPARTIGNQLLRSATSVGANYRAACRARSRAEFIARIGVALEEADEACYWLELLLEGGLVTSSEARQLLEEANELCAIMVASSLTAKRNGRH